MNPPPTTHAAFLIFGAGTPWVYALGASLAERGNFVHLVAPYDLPNFRRLRPTWPKGEPPARLQRDFWILPPGYVGRFEKLFRPFLRWRVGRTLAALQRKSMTVHPWVIVPYPWFGEIARAAPDARLIYYNLDDYVLYQPERRPTILRQETDLLARGALTICLSQTQTEALRTRCPTRARDIHHFPLGVVDAFLNPRPELPPQPNTVGYVGNLIDRVDWRLVGEVARALPEVEFVFVGGLDGFSGGGQRQDWKSERDAVLALPNVRSVGPVAQAEVYEFYWNSTVNWIPYATDHAFNRAACPTKIMDAFAAGRPVVSTDIPECRLYPEWIAVAGTAIEMADLLRRTLATGETTGRAVRQVGFARGQTWARRAASLESLLLEKAVSPPGDGQAGGQSPIFA